MEGMEIMIPNELLRMPSSVMGLGAKLIVSAVFSHPRKTQQEVADMLGTSRRNVAKAVALGKRECEHLFTGYEHTFTKREQSFSPYLVEEEVKGKRVARRAKVSMIPTLEEVAAHAESLGRPDLAEEFHSANTDNDWQTADGEPIANWKSWFRGWTRRNPQAAVAAKPRKRKLTPEEARMEMDSNGSY